MSDVHGPHDFDQWHKQATKEEREAYEERCRGSDHPEHVPLPPIHTTTFTEGYKDTNPKDAVGIKKAPLSTVPMPFLFAVGNAMLEGARKYGRHNYRAAGVRASVYVDAMMRHIAAYWEGQDIDPDSGEHHLIKIAACCAVLHDCGLRGEHVDDRPPKSPEGWMEHVNKRAAHIVEKYPDPPLPWTEERMK